MLGICTTGAAPCTAPDTCDEALNACVSCPGSTLEFTLGADRLTGTECDDVFNALFIFNAPTGTNIPSLQTGDVADGGHGFDTLNAYFNHSFGSTIAPTLSNIESINITDYGTSATTPRCSDSTPCARNSASRPFGITYAHW